MSPAIIASHFPKNKGVTVCPTLLAIQCRGCGKRGHTISYCKPTTLSKETTLVAKPKETKSKETKKETKPKTAYDSLYMSDDDDATVVIQIQEPKEKKEKKAKTVGPAKKFCWATAESESSGSDEEEEEE